MVVLIAALAILGASAVSSPANTRKYTEARVIGCRGVIEEEEGRSIVYCVGNCNRTCAIVRKGISGGLYPDQLELFDNGASTLQSPCLLLGTSPDGTEVYVLMP